jgi:hypothetical protein
MSVQIETYLFFFSQFSKFVEHLVIFSAFHVTVPIIFMFMINRANYCGSVCYLKTKTKTEGRMTNNLKYK